MKENNWDPSRIKTNQANDLHLIVCGSGGNGGRVDTYTPSKISKDDKIAASGTLPMSQRITNRKNMCLVKCCQRKAVVSVFVPESWLESETTDDTGLESATTVNTGTGAMVFLGIFAFGKFEYTEYSPECVEKEHSVKLKNSEVPYIHFKEAYHFQFRLRYVHIKKWPGANSALGTISMTTRNTSVFLKCTNGTLEDALSVRSKDKETRDSLIGHFLDIGGWSEFAEEETSLDDKEADIRHFCKEESGTRVKRSINYDDLFQCLRCISVAQSMRFMKKNIVSNRLKGQVATPLTKSNAKYIGDVLALKSVPMPGRMMDVFTMWFVWCFGNKRTDRIGSEWCKTNIQLFADMMIGSFFGRLTGRVIRLEKLSDHLKENSIGNNDTGLGNQGPCLPGRDNLEASICFIEATLTCNGRKTME